MDVARAAAPVEAQEKAVAYMDTFGGIDIEWLRKHIRSMEGEKLVTYTDSLGKVTAGIGHRCAITAWGQPHLGLRQRELPPALAAACQRGLEPGHGAFTGSRGCAGRGSATSPTGSASSRTHRRLAILAVCAVEWEMFLADAVVETHDRLVGRTYREAARACEAQRGDATVAVREMAPGHSPSWGRRCSVRGTPARPSTR